MTALRNRAKEIRQRSHAITHEYSLESRSAIFPARCFKNRSHSGPVEPEVANTSGRKEPWSTLMMCSSYSSCLACWWSWQRSENDLSRYDEAPAWKTRTSKNAASRLVQKRVARTSACFAQKWSFLFLPIQIVHAMIEQGFLLPQPRSEVSWEKVLRIWGAVGIGGYHQVFCSRGNVSLKCAWPFDFCFCFKFADTFSGRNCCRCYR